jgi:hypothetical protein
MRRTIWRLFTRASDTWPRWKRHDRSFGISELVSPGHGHRHRPHNSIEAAGALQYRAWRVSQCANKGHGPWIVEDRQIVTLRQIHTQYNNLVNSQEALNHIIFTTRVAEAVARLPTLTGLSITDSDDFELCHISTELSTSIYTSFRDRLLLRHLVFPVQGGLF